MPVPVEKVEMMLIKENGSMQVIPAGTTITLTKGKHGGFACVVTLKGTSVDPDIKLTAGGEDVSSKLLNKTITRSSGVVNNKLVAQS